MNLTRDASGNNTFGLPFSKFNYDTTLVSGVEQTITVPGDSVKWLMIFSYQPGNVVWVANNETATVAGAAVATTNSELNPVAREVSAADVVHFITSDASTIIGVSLHAI
jgi:hypothetical protein